MSDNLNNIIANNNSNFTTNGIGAITGLVTRTQLNDAFTKCYEDIRGMGYWCKGIASTGTFPGTPDEKCFYFNEFSTSNKTYTGFGGIVVPANQLGILQWNQLTWQFVSLLDVSSLVSNTAFIIVTMGASGSFNIPANSRIDRIMFNSIGGAADINLGITPGGIEICENQHCDADGYSDMGSPEFIVYYDQSNQRTIYYTNSNTLTYARVDLTLNTW